MLAEIIGGPAEVRLHRPPPLQRPLTVSETDDTHRLFDGDTLVAEGKPTSVDVEVPDPVGLADAEEAAQHYLGFEFHGAPRCFVCGPDRPDDGLGVYPGPVAGRDIVASPWTPDDRFAGPDGLIAGPVIWAVLDCPGAFAVYAADQTGMPYFAALGTMAAVIHEPVRAGQQLVVAAWHLATEGRKLHTAAALFEPDGTTKARARHIELKVPADWAS